MHFLCQNYTRKHTHILYTHKQCTLEISICLEFYASIYNSCWKIPFIPHSLTFFSLSFSQAMQIFAKWNKFTFKASIRSQGNGIKQFASNFEQNISLQVSRATMKIKNRLVFQQTQQWTHKETSTVLWELFACNNVSHSMRLNNLHKWNFTKSHHIFVHYIISHY